MAPRMAFALTAAPLRVPSQGRHATCRRRSRACAERAATEPASAEQVAAAAESGGASYVTVPGKVVLGELELASQKTRLERLAADMKQKRLVKEYESSRKFGFVPFAEKLNGRSAAFFFVVGLLTEYWTGYTIPQQVELMLNTVGVF